MADRFDSMSKGHFFGTKGLFPMTKGLLLESTAVGLESKKLFVESDGLLRNAVAHWRTAMDRNVRRCPA